jgi:hypothetical protein
MQQSLVIYEFERMWKEFSFPGVRYFRVALHWIK